MDPRASRTRASLESALLTLARERALDDISVADIVERAGVNRSSFYQHYADKEILLADALESEVDHLSETLRVRPPTDGATIPHELFLYLAHIAENAAVYRLVLGEHGSPLVAARLRGQIEQIVLDTVPLAKPDAFPGLPLDIVASGIAGSAFGVLIAWLARDPLPGTDTAAEWLWRVLIGPGEGWGATGTTAEQK
ncbi:TetR/AcrR family transcriptional regulator [Microbacterium sp. cx-59]|uniref:TetR/AcrR family transcriptional regulator n=1 Tax=Microbacterium sp. cx-59 TaxID=2891207 RepID=UPI001E3A314A|nr:TetR/AcrR family transcriptional regulator [Microbacterium sp. cx-59]MCC4907029.1 TetR/AcrR family transcriptional regulator [Microbacterium sp. cx-59]